MPAPPRAAVELPIHLLGLERLVEVLEQAQVCGRAVVDAHMAGVPVDMRLEASRDKARTIVGDEKRVFASGPCQHSCPGSVGKFVTFNTQRIGSVIGCLPGLLSLLSGSSASSKFRGYNQRLCR